MDLCLSILDLAVQVEAEGTEIQWLNHMQGDLKTPSTRRLPKLSGLKKKLHFPIKPSQGLVPSLSDELPCKFFHASNDS